jgi:hypothetical protein
MSAGTGISLPWQTLSGNFPQPPHNGQIVTAYIPQTLDIRWDDPTLLPNNTMFNIVGVNVYRSDVSDLGPYHRLNPYPLGGSYYRDQTNIQPVVNEPVDWATSWVDKGDAPNNRMWVFRTKQACTKPQQFAPYSSATPACTPTDVLVTVDGYPVAVDNVFGPTGEITLVNQPTFDVTTQKYVPLHLPTAESTVLVSYYTADENQVRSGLDTKLFYRITTVAIDPQDPTNLVETPLHLCQPFTNIATETLDYIWREAVRRNSWILQQGGERVKVFVRKQSGIVCYHGRDPRTIEYDGQPTNRCLACYGTGFLGGYEGPYETLIGPDDAERKISQGPNGRRMEHTYEIWTGPSPLVTQRDFVVKQTNERYSIGPVRRPSNRGNVLQQHFSIGYLDEGDIRYKVPIVGITTLPWPQTRYVYDPTTPYPVLGTTYQPVQEGDRAVSPMETDKDGVSPGNQQRGRTVTWENQNYFWPFVLFLSGYLTQWAHLADYLT